MPGFLTDEAQAEMEASFENNMEAFRLLDLIDAEFRSDPTSTQCFDASIVERVRICMERRKAFVAKHPLYAE